MSSRPQASPHGEDKSKTSRLFSIVKNLRVDSSASGKAEAAARASFSDGVSTASLDSGTVTPTQSYTSDPFRGFFGGALASTATSAKQPRPSTSSSFGNEGPLPSLSFDNTDVRTSHRLSMTAPIGRSVSPGMPLPLGPQRHYTLGMGNGATSQLCHRALVVDLLKALTGNYTSTGARRIRLDGMSLSLGELVAISRFGASCAPHESRRADLERSRDILLDSVAAGEAVYGTNTMFGGNAAAKNDPAKIQKALAGLLYGVMPSDLTLAATTTAYNEPDLSPFVPIPVANAEASTQFASTIVQAHALPAAWVRGAMVLRLNNFLRGNSAVRWDVVEMLSRMLTEELTPLVPSQGSISASGDLSPLAYIAFAMAGHDSIQLLRGRGAATKLLPSSVALRTASITPLTFSPKEVLAITNGTSVSCSVAAHTLADAHILVMLAQLVCAANAEAMMASQDSFDAFLSDECRPHPGQIEVAANLRSFLSGSLLTHKGKSPRSALARSLQLALDLTDYEAAELSAIGNGFFLTQDRYPFRTAPQWLGPPVEDLMAAHRTVGIEMNAATDNPLVDLSCSASGGGVGGGGGGGGATMAGGGGGGLPRVLSGGNFQALAVTNATEKVRDVAAYAGRLLFAQQEELLNPALSYGLPSNLTLGEPSIEGGFKGVSIGCAALTSELGYLASRAGHFVQAAEMQNQSLNSLALISARSTASSIETLTKLVASTMVMACQALDLRICFIAHLRLLASKLSEWLALPTTTEAGATSTSARTTSLKESLERRPRKRALHKLVAVIALALMRHTALDSMQRAILAGKDGARAMLELEMEEEMSTASKVSEARDKRSRKSSSSTSSWCGVLLLGAGQYLDSQGLRPFPPSPDLPSDGTASTDEGDDISRADRRSLSDEAEERSVYADASSIAPPAPLGSDPFLIASAADQPPDSPGWTKPASRRQRPGRPSGEGDPDSSARRGDRSNRRHRHRDHRDDRRRGTDKTRQFFSILEPALVHVVQATFEQSRDAYFRASRAKSVGDSASPPLGAGGGRAARSQGGGGGGGGGGGSGGGGSNGGGDGLVLPTSPLPYVGKGTAALYKLVREQVGIRMHRSVSLDEPGTMASSSSSSSAAGAPHQRAGAGRRTRRLSARWTRMLDDSVDLSAFGIDASALVSPSTPTQSTASSNTGSRSRSSTKDGTPVPASTASGYGNGRSHSDEGKSQYRDRHHDGAEDKDHDNDNEDEDEYDKAPRRTMGDTLSVLYEALREPHTLLAVLDGVLSQPGGS